MVTVTSVSPYSEGEARIKEGVNRRKDKTRKTIRRKSSVFFSRKKFLRLLSRGSISLRTSVYLLRYTILQFSLLSHCCHNVILKLRYRSSALSLLRTGSNVKHRVININDCRKEREKKAKIASYIFAP